MHRRRFTLATGSAVAGLVLGGASLFTRPFAAGTAPSSGTAAAGVGGASAADDARLTPRPKSGVKTTLTTGPLGLGGERDGVVQMPSTVPDGPLPVMLFLHGATQTGTRMMSRISAAAEAAGVVVVAPDSRRGTWDAIRGGFGEDVTYLNRVLTHVFSRVDVDPKRLSIAGFSDGATYAISLGLANGDLFPHVLAFSPGFVVRAPEHGHPRFFFSHGTNDQILPIGVCSRVIVPQLRGRGFDVTYREFEGRHELPPEIQADAFKWLLQA